MNLKTCFDIYVLTGSFLVFLKGDLIFKYERLVNNSKLSGGRLLYFRCYMYCLSAHSTYSLSELIIAYVSKNP